MTGASQGLDRRSRAAWRRTELPLRSRRAIPAENPEEEIRAQGGPAPPRCRWDPTETAYLASAVHAAEAALGPISVLIDNARIAIEKARLNRTEAVVGANLKGGLFCSDRLT